MPRRGKKSEVVYTDRGWAKTTAAISELHKAYVDVGVHEDATGEHGVHVADKAAANEFGTWAIPERSFMRSTFDEQAEALGRLRARLVGGVIDGKITPAQAIGFLGEQHQKDIQAKILDGAGVPPPNHPKTIARKKSSRPLVDTGEMVQSIRWVVVRRTKGTLRGFLSAIFGRRQRGIGAPERPR